MSDPAVRVGSAIERPRNTSTRRRSALALVGLLSVWFAFATIGFGGGTFAMWSDSVVEEGMQASAGVWSLDEEPPALQQVQIDVSGPIDPGSDGAIRVAILSTQTFDAMTVDPDSVCFGSAGVDADQRACAVAAGQQPEAKNTDGGGPSDLILHFATSQTRIAHGDTRVVLTGATVDGVPIEGSSEIRTVTPNKGPDEGGGETPDPGTRDLPDSDQDKGDPAGQGNAPVDPETGTEEGASDGSAGNELPEGEPESNEERGGAESDVDGLEHEDGADAEEVEDAGGLAGTVEADASPRTNSDEDGSSSNDQDNTGNQASGDSGVSTARRED